MGIEFSVREISVLHSLLAEGAQDFILKTDRHGFIRSASPSLERLGVSGVGGLIDPHLFDIVHPAHLDTVRSAFRSAMAGRSEADWIEAPLVGSHRNERWFAIRIRSLENRLGETYGALAVLRSVEERRALEEMAFAAQVTDRLTGLANRCAFNQMVSHLVHGGADGSLVLFDIERFRSINLEHGQAVGDAVLCRTADTLRAITRPSDILARIGSEKFAVLMERTPVSDAQALSVEMLAELEAEAGSLMEARLPVSFRCGVAALAPTLDETMKAAELALMLCKAKNCRPVEAARQRRLRFLSQRG